MEFDSYEKVIVDSPPISVHAFEKPYFYIELPKPPSVNKLYATVKGRRVLSAAGRAYKLDVKRRVMVSEHRHCLPIEGYLKLTIEFIQVDHIGRDIDNLVKILQDSLKEAGVFSDDKLIDDLHVVRRRRFKDGENRIYVTVEPIEK